MKRILGYLNDEITEECTAFVPRARTRAHYIMHFYFNAISTRANYCSNRKDSHFASIYLTPLPRAVFNLQICEISKIGKDPVKLTTRSWKRFRNICIQSSSRYNTHKYRVTHLNNSVLNKIKYYADM